MLVGDPITPDYIDWVCSWGPLILGHAEPSVIEAVTAAAELGTSYGAATEGEVRLAAEVAERFGSVRSRCCGWSPPGPRPG